MTHPYMGHGIVVGNHILPERQISSDIPRPSPQPLTHYHKAPEFNGRDPQDRTSFVPGQEYLREDNLPYLLGLLDPLMFISERDVRTLKHQGRDVLDINGFPMRDLPILPSQISTEVEGWRMVAWMTYDPRVSYNDIRGRFRLPYTSDNELTPGEDALAYRVGDWRIRYGGMGRIDRVSMRHLEIIERAEAYGNCDYNTVWRTNLQNGIMEQYFNCFRMGFPLPDYGATRRVRGLRLVLAEVKNEAQQKGHSHWIDLLKTDSIARRRYLNKDYATNALVAAESRAQSSSTINRPLLPRGGVAQSQIPGEATAGPSSSRYRALLPRESIVQSQIPRRATAGPSTSTTRTLPPQVSAEAAQVFEPVRDDENAGLQAFEPVAEDEYDDGYDDGYDNAPIHEPVPDDEYDNAPIHEPVPDNEYDNVRIHEPVPDDDHLEPSTHQAQAQHRLWRSESRRYLREAFPPVVDTLRELYPDDDLLDDDE